MIVITYETEWDYHTSKQYIYMEDNEVVASYSISSFPEDDYKVFERFYVIPSKRGNGLSHIMMKEISNLKEEIWCLVHKDNWVRKLYERYGFEYQYDEGDYFWMSKN